MRASFFRLLVFVGITYILLLWWWVSGSSTHANAKKRPETHDAFGEAAHRQARVSDAEGIRTRRPKPVLNQHLVTDRAEQQPDDEVVETPLPLPPKTTPPRATTHPPKRKHKKQPATPPPQQHDDEEADATAPDTEFHGVDLEVKDKKSHANPGGTEREALEVRRRLSKKNVHAHALQDIAWHEGPKWKTPVGLLRSQRVLPDSTQLRFDEATETCDGDLDCMLSKYPESSSKSCDKSYGKGLITAMKANEHVLCDGGKSKVVCKSVRAHSSHDMDMAACQITNFAVDLSKINDGDFPWLAFGNGAVLADCAKTQDADDHWRFMHCQADWMNLGFKEGKNTKPCAMTIDEPVYLETRSGDYSPFAMAHDWVNTIITFAAFDVDLKTIRTFIFDRMTVGFYTPVWQLAFSSKPLTWYTDLREQYAGKRLCFKKAMMNIPARLSPLYNQDECRGSSLLLLFRDYVLHSVGALRTTSLKENIVITVIVRRNYNTGHSIGRRFGNLKELVAGIRGLDKDYVVNEVDYADMDFDAQLNVSRATDVLVAIHGAGLIHMMFQHEHGGVFEFFCPEKPSSNFRYQQLSSRLNMHYDSLSIENDQNKVDLGASLPRLHKLIKKVAKSKSESVHVR